MRGQKVGFIGQGFIGKHMADDFEQRGYDIVRYSLEPAYEANRQLIKKCSIVFVAVPTPTTPSGFDSSIVAKALANVGDGATVVIKSTILPGTTKELQEQYPKLYVMHSPEFLREKSAAEDTAHPERNIIGIPEETGAYRTRAEEVMATLPKAPYELITSSRTAECVKYIGNTFLYTKLIFMNLAYDFAIAAGADWNQVAEAVTKDSRIGSSHVQPLDATGGRGAGGHCFIKDFEALIGFFEKSVDDSRGIDVLHALRDKNNKLLIDSKKDLDLLEGVYGDALFEYNA